MKDLKNKDKEKAELDTVPDKMPTIEFNKETPKEKQPTAGDMVEQAFTQAVVTTVMNDEEVQNELLEGAEKVIKNKTNEILARAEKEEKEAHFNNKKSACECFGYNETTTEKWAVNIMAFWHNVLTALWIILGTVTFAPVTFVAKKLSVIIKNTWLAVIVAVLIYVLVTTAPVWVGWLAKIGG